MVYFLFGALVGMFLMCLVQSNDSEDDYDKDTEYEQENV